MSTAAQKKAKRAEAKASKLNGQASNGEAVKTASKPKKAKKPAAKKSTKPAKASKPKEKVAKTPKAAKEPKVKKVSLLDAAAKVLATSSEPMTKAAMYEAVVAKKLWTPKNGATPIQTLGAAIIREIEKNGKESRFKKVDRGLFSTN